jgi:hypothetical protein
LTFPKFDGSNPRLWVKCYETYFDVYVVDLFLWVKIASMNLVGSTALWSHTLQHNLCTMFWDEFTIAACHHFDKDEHNQLLRQFFHIK